MALAYQLETRNGVRMVEFDPDVILGRDVRVLVDGQRVAEMPYPKAAAPYSEAAFNLDGDPLVAAAYLPAEATPSAALDLACDLFAAGRSVSDGSALSEFRKRAPAPGNTYPGRFKLIDITLRIAPAASVPGLSSGVLRRANELGWPLAIELLAILLGAIGVATVVAARAWEPIRADASRSVSSRTLRGWAVVLACYLVAGIAIVVLGLTIGQRR